ncbi:FAD:protein FMN transferase [Knoellia aerolata]|uniref:FAD:protein FMN transferase n=1 Tax=Knoellia aerolata DSM 18566 TaxID=1385519 RepID=A0A0A0JUX6_9MICO|nr:FAD:protein FMN transferase [Knoellia aerolata]KGN40489.1 hypothetical protein N801_13210 [Knoellia aerolata DSM 18566]
MITGEVPVRAARGDRHRAPWGRRAFVRQLMGLPVSVHVRAEQPDRSDVAAAADRVFAHLRRVDRVLSTWRADSDLLRLQHGELDDGEAHPWLAEVVELSLEAEDRTDGLFRAWRSRDGGRVAFDPLGLVKGWAVAGAAAHLDTVPAISYSIGAGGDIVVGAGRGMGGGEPVWRIGIEDPADRTRVLDVVSLTRGAVATSGATARGAHIVDPRTGQGLSRAGSATVVGPDLMWADVWATAAFVDPAQAARLMSRKDPAYRLITHRMGRRP